MYRRLANGAGEGPALGLGTPLELYNYPANLFVAGFIGSPRMNFITGEVAEIRNGELEFRGKSGLSLMLPIAGAPPRAGETVTVGVRPEHLRIVEPDKGILVGDVQIAEHLGGETFLYVALPFGETLVVEIQGQAAAQPDERVGVDFQPGAHHLFSADGSVIPGRESVATPGSPLAAR